MAEIDQPRSFNAWASTSSPCVNMGNGAPSIWTASSTASVDGAPPRLVDLLQGHPAAHSWGISVIRSGESPVIAPTGAERSEGLVVAAAVTMPNRRSSSRRREPSVRDTLGVSEPTRRRRKETPVEHQQQYVGIDLHRRRSVIVRMTGEGKVVEVVRIVN